MNHVECENEIKCGQYLRVMNIKIEWIKKAWIPYCKNEITYNKLESLRKKYNRKIKLMILSFDIK